MDIKTEREDSHVEIHSRDTKDKAAFNELKILLLDILLPLLDILVDIAKAVVLVFEGQQIKNYQRFSDHFLNTAVYGVISVMLKWCPAVVAALHFQDMNRYKYKLQIVDTILGDPIVFSFLTYLSQSFCVIISSHCRKQKRVFPSQTGTRPDGEMEEGKSSPVSVQQVMATLAKCLLHILAYPFLHIFHHSRLLVEADLTKHQLASELSLIFSSVEAPLQIMLTLWLILRGIVVSPLSSHDLRLVSWSRDKFGNPIPLPTLPLASIITSLSSLVLAAVRLHSRNVVFTSFKEQFWSFAEKMSFVLFSLCLRLLALTYLAIYFHTKTVVLLVSITLIHFFLSYRLQYGAGGGSGAGGGGFSIWLTSFLNIFLPCWFHRKPQIEDKLMERLALINIPSNLVILVWVAVAFSLVQWSEFKYNNNILNNEDFIIVTVSILIFLTIQMFVMLFYLRKEKMILAQRTSLTFVTSTASLLSGLVLIFQLGLHSPLHSGVVTVISQHYQDSQQPEIFLKSYRAQHLAKYGDLFGELATCHEVLEPDFNVTEKKILLFDPTDQRCELIRGQSLSGITIPSNIIHYSST